MRAAVFSAIVVVSGCSTPQMPHESVPSAGLELWQGRALHQRLEIVQVRVDGATHFVRCVADACPQPTPKVLGGVNQADSLARPPEEKIASEPVMPVIQITGEWSEAKVSQAVQQLIAKLPKHGGVLNFKRQYQTTSELALRERSLLMALVRAGFSMVAHFDHTTQRGAPTFVLA